MNNTVLTIFLLITLFSSNSPAQQNYSGISILNCQNSHLYICNGEKPTCKAFLIFRTKPPYITVSSISNFTSSVASEFARLNNISFTDILPSDKEVIIPITCSCSGGSYQANTSYVSPANDDTYFTIANNIYQGLTTCNALMRNNPFAESDLHQGLRFQVPLRCACPTKEQIGNGTKFLLTYVVTGDDNDFVISRRFDVNNTSLTNANGLSNQDPILYPLTTILIPLREEPSASQTRTRPTSGSKPSPMSPQEKRKSLSKALLVGIVIGSCLAVLCFALFLGFFYHRKETLNEPSSNGSQTKKLQEHILDRVAGIGEMLKVYSVEELAAATGNFGPHKKLSNCVHRGVLHGKQVAIRKSTKRATNEIEILRRINHFNLISLCGFCEHDQDVYLVYDFMENGSLKEWLKKEGYFRNWNCVIRIALDVANGLHYLHNFTSPAYVHKNINSWNILLDCDLRAKIANFSLARLASRGSNGNSLTSGVTGAKGYMAPEYLWDGNVTPKVDVYAFGVVLLELITGKDAVLVESGEEIFLSERIMSTLDRIDMNAEVNGLIDPCLQVKNALGFIIDQTKLALRLLKLSIACLEREPENRMSTGEVVSTLMKIQLDVQNSESYSIDVCN